MDIGKHEDIYRFYEGYEGEKEIIISLSDTTYHFWDGYFEDIFGNPQSSATGWTGFTRDYNECINAFEDTCIECALIPNEYLKDLKLYQGHNFMYPETKDVLECLIKIMENSIEKGEYVYVKVN